MIKNIVFVLKKLLVGTYFHVYVLFILVLKSLKSNRSKEMVSDTYFSQTLLGLKPSTVIYFKNPC